LTAELVAREESLERQREMWITEQTSWNAERHDLEEQVRVIMRQFKAVKATTDDARNRIQDGSEVEVMEDTMEVEGAGEGMEVEQVEQVL